MGNPEIENCRCPNCMKKPKSINDFPDYLIYPDGRVFSIRRQIFMKQTTKRNGYKDLILSNDNYRKSFLVHRLVAIHFIDNPENKPTVDHINGIRDDNRVENLRWATLKEQCQNKKVHTIRRDNRSGHKFILFSKTENKWKYHNQNQKFKIQKRFDTKIDAICYKFIINSRITAGHFN